MIGVVIILVQLELIFAGSDSTVGSVSRRFDCWIWHLSVIGESLSTDKPLRFALPRKSVVRLTDCPYMTYTVEVKQEISAKATKTMGFLRRNLAFASRHTKEVAYKTLVRPKLEYAAPIWHPNHESQIGQAEKVQRTAARWTCRRWMNTRSISDMLDELEWPSLETRREQSSLTVFYKIHSGTVSLHSLDKDKYLTPA